MTVSAWSGLAGLVEVAQGGRVPFCCDLVGSVLAVVSRCEKVLSGSAGFVVAVLLRQVMVRLGMLRCGGLVN